MLTNFDLLQACSNNFLTTEIPDNFLDLDECQQYQFLCDHAWQPVENFPPDQIWQLIESSADTMSNFLVQKQSTETPSIVESPDIKLFTLTVEVNVAKLTQAYLEPLKTDEPDSSLLSMIEHECHWLEESGIHVRKIQDFNNLQPDKIRSSISMSKNWSRERA